MERYSRKKSDGTFVYYDSREEMNADIERSAVAWIAFAAFFIGGAIAFLTLASFSLDGLPRWAKFTAILASSAASSYLGWRYGRAILAGIFLLLGLLLLLAVGALVWHLVGSI